MKHYKLKGQCEKLIAEYKKDIADVEIIQRKLEKGSKLTLRCRSLGNRSKLAMTFAPEDPNSIKIDADNFNATWGIWLSRRHAARLRNFLDTFLEGK